MNKNNLRLKIVQANIAENLKVFLLISLDAFNDEQVDWLMQNL